ncbi:DUF4145 domain-containing protein [Undibacterium sp. TC9W]|uniref:DUF4145 domain-containing protein n=1 Tax=Undibacterium sp. TC9W TaxID=3413053 RepID=UPI003BEF7702
MNAIFAQRFDDLAAQLQAIKVTSRVIEDGFTVSEDVDSELFLKWVIKVRSLLNSVCGDTSQHFKQFEISSKAATHDSSLNMAKRLGAIFNAAKEDFEGGYLTTLKKLVQADVFESELEQAQELLDNNYTLAAAVIAGVVLETAIRDLCDANGIGHGKLDFMNAELAKKGIFNKLQQKQITALADIRNSAAHGKPNEFTKVDVTNMIREVEQFLLSFLK